jgi:hypothetical protein
MFPFTFLGVELQVCCDTLQFLAVNYVLAGAWSVIDIYRRRNYLTDQNPTLDIFKQHGCACPALLQSRALTLAVSMDDEKEHREK